MGQDKVIKYLEDNSEATIKEIAEYYNTSYNTINVYMMKLMKKGKVERNKVYVGKKRHPTYYYHLKRD